MATAILLKELQLQLFAIQSEIQSDNTKLCKILTQIPFYASSAFFFQTSALSVTIHIKTRYCIAKILQKKK